MPGPIDPKEIVKLKSASLPEAVYEVFNELLVLNWKGNSAMITQ
jgi:hypothetical protein